MIVELIQAHPKLSIIVISILVSLFITLVNFFVLDKERMRELKKKQKELNDQIKAHTDPAKKMELTQQMMQHTMESMKHSFKPMIFTMIPVLVVFSLIRGVFNTTSIAGHWFWYYFITAIIASMVFRKLFKLP
jgi:uncharacterized membrane protein (DUF106 family)